MIELAYNLIATNAKLILIGVPHYKSKLSINTLGINLGKQIIGSKGGNINPHIDIKKFIDNSKIITLIFLSFMKKHIILIK